jgi:hypothetical protein
MKRVGAMCAALDWIEERRMQGLPPKLRSSGSEASRRKVKPPLCSSRRHDYPPQDIVRRQGSFLALHLSSCQLDRGHVIGLPIRFSGGHRAVSWQLQLISALPSRLAKSFKNFLQNFAKLAPRHSLVRGIISLILDCDGIGIEAASGLYAKGYEDARA